MKTLYAFCSLSLLAGFSVGAGCWGVAGSHCGNVDGDQTCIERGGGTYCNTCRPENDGCSDVMPPDGCHFAGPDLQGSADVRGETTSTSSPDGTSNTTLPVDNTTSDGMSAEGMTLALTGESGETGGQECFSDGDCEEPTPFCGTNGACVASCGETLDSNAACAGVSADLPVCVNDDCVTCEDGLMLVDITGACVPCTEHDQCESRACDIFEGTCFDPDSVVDVGGQGQPETIAEGLAALEVMGLDRRGERRGVLVLHHEGSIGNTDFNEAATITAAAYDAVAFIAADDFPNWTNTNTNSPTLIVADSLTRTYLDGVRVLNHTNATNGQSLRCDDAHVDIRRSRLVENLGGGIVALGQCELVVQNSFVGVNADEPAADGTDALLISDSDVTATILYSTLGAGQGDGASALNCTAGADVDVRNSLLVSLASTQEVDCPGATLMNNATEAGGLGNMSPDWFVDYYIGNFHLQAGAPLGVNIAMWQPGAPMTDIDGDPRFLILGRAGADGP